VAMGPRCQHAPPLVEGVLRLGDFLGSCNAQASERLGLARRSESGSGVELRQVLCASR
jgi:hypothetical protein